MKYGKERMVAKFLFLPLTLNGITKHFSTELVVQRVCYRPGWDRGGPEWRDVRWYTEGETLSEGHDGPGSIVKK